MSPSRLLFFAFAATLASASLAARAPLPSPNTDLPQATGLQKAVLAGGCFWGVEHLFRKHFEGKGLLDAKVGYIGGDTSNPGYRAVCSGRTGRKYNPSHRFHWTQC